MDEECKKPSDQMITHRFELLTLRVLATTSILIIILLRVTHIFIVLGVIVTIAPTMETDPSSS
jgi:hypothetical protein